VAIEVYYLFIFQESIRESGLVAIVLKVI